MPYRNVGEHAHALFDDLSITACQDCASFWVVEPPAERRIIEYYEKEYRPGRMSPVLQNKWPHFDSRPASLITLARLFCEFKPHDVFVDVGPGNGSALAAANYLLPSPKLACIEFNSQSIDYFKRNIREIFICDSISALIDHYGKKSAQMILSSHCYEHFDIASLKDHLAEAKRLLSTGGAIVVEVPYEHVAKSRSGRHSPHLVFFSERGLGALLRNAGYDVKICVNVVGRTGSSKAFLDKKYSKRPKHPGLKTVFDFLNSGDLIYREVEPRQRLGHVIKCVATLAN